MQVQVSKDRTETVEQPPKKPGETGVLEPDQDLHDAEQWRSTGPYDQASTGGGGLPALGWF